MSNKARSALLAIVDTLAEAVNASPHGLPEGHLYAMLMAYGCTLDQFNGLVSAMVQTGKIRKRGNLLLPV